MLTSFWWTGLRGSKWCFRFLRGEYQRSAVVKIRGGCALVRSLTSYPGPSYTQKLTRPGNIHCACADYVDMNVIMLHCTDIL